MLMRFLRDCKGGTAIEYSMIAALIALLLITALSGIGVSLEGIFEAVETGFDGPTP
jgi:pilus assembly protein Flp/PilA